MAHKVAIINGKQPSAGIGGVSDADFSNLAVNFFIKGVVSAGDYQVFAQTTPDMTVRVLAGKAYVQSPDQKMMYQSELDAQATVTISPNTSGNPRIDALVLKVDLGLTPNNYADNVATIIPIQGTPAASPAAPNDSAVQSAVGSGNPFIRLSDITVNNGATSITNGNISDKRTAAGFRIQVITLSTGIFDVNGNELIKFNTVPSAVNEVQIKNAIAGFGPEIFPSGDDTNIELTLKGKGNKGVRADVSYGAINPLGNLGSGVPATTTISATTSNRHSCTLNGNNATLSIVIPNAGQSLILEVVQASMGGPFTAVWSGVTWENGITPIFSTTANKKDLFAFYNDGSVIMGSKIMGNV
ncbi:MAG: hypothetical protein M3Q44_04070 [bacterium]|nr:hypothetical protein [bacterium]